MVNSILEDFPKTQSGILFDSVVHLKTFCHYLFCLISTSFSVKVFSLVKGVLVSDSLIPTQGKVVDHT